MAVAAVVITVIVGLLTNQLTSHWGWGLGIGLLVSTGLLGLVAWGDRSVQQNRTSAATTSRKSGTPGPGDVRNSMSGSARDVVQIGRADAVYLNERRSKDAPPARMLPRATENFTNQVVALGKASDGVVHDGDRDGPKIVVIQGPPGIGTTQAALVLAHRRKTDYPDGQFYADLGSRTGEPGALHTILGDFLIRRGFAKDDLPDSTEARAGWFRSSTEDHAVLVVIDGAVSAEQVQMLLPGPGRSMVVVTERAPLSDLSVTEAVTFVELHPLEDDAAELLLTRIIGSARAEAEPDAVREVVRRCAGLPVALGAAGSLVRRFGERPIARLVEALRDEQRRLSVLSPGTGISVAAVFNAAYRRLKPVERRVYGLLGLEPSTGQVSLDLLKHLTGLPVDEVRAAMDELIASKLAEEPFADRYLVREWIRKHTPTTLETPERELLSTKSFQFHREVLLAAEDVVAGRRGWRQLFFPEVTVRPDHLAADRDAAWRWLEAERANLLACIEFAAKKKWHNEVLLMNLLLFPLYEKGKHDNDLLLASDFGIDAAVATGNQGVHSVIRSQRGYAYRDRWELDKAAAEFTEAVDLARLVNLDIAEGTALEGGGLTLFDQGDTPGAQDALRRNHVIATASGDDRRLAIADMLLARVEHPERAFPLLDEAARLFAGMQQDESVNLAKVATCRGMKLIEAGRYGDAAEPLNYALLVMEERNRWFDRAVALEALGDLARAQGAPDRARESYREALRIYETRRFDVQADHLRRKLDDQD
ncbi:NB-ARC domain-containing protein [Amycolatopsis sp. NBC_00345]|uniref:NB-ARC domain-containing protein n=1 Tax=Amycolatopsis sp. NBC_00345 TaxID=2975955 RepID=UPI002E27698E